MLSDKFETLPAGLRLIHLGSLFLIAAAVILLIAPAAYHRLAADGEPREDVDLLGPKSVLGALVPLALGLSANLYVITVLKAKSTVWVSATAGAALIAFAGLSSAFPLLARRSGRRSAK
jgi:hypothetical protein